MRVLLPMLFLLRVPSVKLIGDMRSCVCVLWEDSSIPELESEAKELEGDLVATFEFHSNEERMKKHEEGGNLREELEEIYTQLMRLYEQQRAKCRGCREEDRKLRRKYLQAKFKSVKVFFPNLNSNMVETWRECLKEQEKEFGSADEDSLLTRVWLGRFTLDLEMLIEGFPLVERIHSRNRKHHRGFPTKFRWLVFDLHRHIGIVYAMKGEFMRSQDSFKSACEVFGNSETVFKNQKVLAVLQHIGIVYTSLGCATEAERYLRICLHRLCDLSPKDNNTTIKCASKYGQALMVQRKYKEAAKVLERCYVKKSHFFGHTHIASMRALSDCVEALWFCGNGSQILALLDASEGFQKWRSAICLLPEKSLLLANILGFVGEFEEAITLLNNLLDTGSVHRDMCPPFNSWEGEEDEDEVASGNSEELNSFSEDVILSCRRTLLDLHLRSGMFPDKRDQIQEIVEAESTQIFEVLFQAAEREPGCSQTPSLEFCDHQNMLQRVREIGSGGCSTVSLARVRSSGFIAMKVGCVWCHIWGLVPPSHWVHPFL